MRGGRHAAGAVAVLLTAAPSAVTRGRLAAGVAVSVIRLQQELHNAQTGGHGDEV